MQVKVLPFFASTPFGQCTDRAGGVKNDATKRSAFFWSMVVVPQPASASASGTSAAESMLLDGAGILMP